MKSLEAEKMALEEAFRAWLAETGRHGAAGTVR
jgi:hypothetical protein